MAPRTVRRGSGGGGRDGRAARSGSAGKRGGSRKRSRPSGRRGDEERKGTTDSSSARGTKTRRRKIDRGAGASAPPRTSGGSKRFAGDALDRLWVSDRASWRAWLEENQGRDAGVWLVTFKRSSGKPRVEYDDAVEEALCFGWIDSVARTVDGERTMQLYTPRKPRSPWSQSNKLRVEKLVGAGLMRAAGLAKIEEAKRDGSWEAYAAVESLEEPADLRAAFAAGPRAAKTNWDAFSPASRRAILWWLHTAKRPETRSRRITTIVHDAAMNRRANFPEDRQRR